jgi:hypothetical protein
MCCRCWHCSRRSWCCRRRPLAARGANALTRRGRKVPQTTRLAKQMAICAAAGMPRLARAQQTLFRHRIAPAGCLLQSPTFFPRLPRPHTRAHSFVPIDTPRAPANPPARSSAARCLVCHAALAAGCCKAWALCAALLDDDSGQRCPAGAGCCLAARLHAERKPTTRAHARTRASAARQMKHAS